MAKRKPPPLSPLAQALRQFDAIKASMDKKAASLRNRLSKKISSSPSSTLPSSGTGYGGTNAGFTKTVLKNMDKKRTEESCLDKTITAALQALEATLPITNDDTDDFTKNTTTNATHIVALLLRNDSLIDLASRQPVYTALFTLLAAISTCPTAAPLLLTSSLHSLLGLLHSQAAMFTNINRYNGDDDEVLAALAMCLHVQSTKEDCDRARASIEERYVSSLSSQRCTTTNLLDLVACRKASHSLLDQNGKPPSTVVGSASLRTKKISMEFSTLMGGLPCHYSSSIFVVADEMRLDVIKALIIGPSGTPYENGCFLFDVLLPPNYPTEPPKVTLVTTAGGKVRFNPNLYAEGKVCLSLLGTWAGPGWDPKTSTLLQVLLSIQGLIFVDDPFHNEPGMEGKTAINLSQSMQIRAATMMHSILPALAGVSSDYVFGRIIREHFEKKKESVIGMVKEWMERWGEGVGTVTGLSRAGWGWKNLVMGGGIVPEEANVRKVGNEIVRRLESWGSDKWGEGQRLGSDSERVRKKEVICLDDMLDEEDTDDDVVVLDDDDGDGDDDEVIIVEKTSTNRAKKRQKVVGHAETGRRAVGGQSALDAICID